MAQTIDAATQAAFPLPDAFSTALTTMIEAVKPAIVQVRTEGHGAGTGIVWYSDGRIITNNHVVARNAVNVEVYLSDGRTFPARVLARNPQLDLALLKVDGVELTSLATNDSSQLRIGHFVFAIGHPWGQRWVVTAGIMSTLSTIKLAENLTTQYIKSDVPLAPGNSGGPLLDADGKVIGINAMIFGGDLSVAIPSNVVNTWLADLPRKATLGIAIQTVTLPHASSAQQTSGVLVAGINIERQEKYHDLLIGDILLSVEGKPIADTTTLLQQLAHQHGRTTLNMQLLRGGVSMTVDVAVLSNE